jgi:addiction module HigA family antidote
MANLQIDEVSEDQLLDLIPPGEILLEEFMKPLGVSQNRLARDIDAPVSRIAGIVKGDRAITADSALRLARFFGTSAEMWMNLQADYDLRVARRAQGKEIEKRVRQLAA